MDAVEQFEAAQRRRRRIVLGVVILLGAGAATVMAYSMRQVAKEAGKPDIEVRDVSSLSDEERADLERQTGMTLPPKPIACPAGMIAGKSYCLDGQDVTVGEFLKCVDAGACPDFRRSDLCPDLRTVSADEPVPCIDFEPSAKYCGWVGKLYLVDELMYAFDRVAGGVQLRCASSAP